MPRKVGGHVAANFFPLREPAGFHLQLPLPLWKLVSETDSPSWGSCHVEIRGLVVVYIDPFCSDGRPVRCGSANLCALDAGPIPFRAFLADGPTRPVSD